MVEDYIDQLHNHDAPTILVDQSQPSGGGGNTGGGNGGGSNGGGRPHSSGGR